MVHYHPVVIVFFRCSFSLVALYAWSLMTKNPSVYKTPRIKPNIIRGIIGALSVMVVLWAYKTLPVGDVAALLNAGPLMSVSLAFFLLKEKLDWQKISILICGFSGVVIMAQPSGLIPLHGVFIGLFAAFSIAATTVLLRYLGRTESAVTMTFYFSLFGTVISGALLPFFWNGWDARLGWLVLLVGIFGLAAQLSHAQALKYLPIAVKEPIGYSFFLWSLLLGFLIWHHVPTLIVLLGSAIVIGSNLLLVFVEYRRTHKIPDLLAK